MTKDQLKTYVQNEISKARTEPALSAISNWADQNGAQQLKMDVSKLQSDLRTLNRESNFGLLSNSEASLQRSKLTYAVLNLLEGDISFDGPKNDPAQQPNHLTILMLTANPAGTTKLNLDKEHSVISEKLQEKKGMLDLYVSRAVNASEFKENTEERRPQVLHFSGHGEDGAQGGIVVQNDDRNGEDLIPSAGLDALFEYFKDDGIGLQTVVLNACYSGEQAAVIAKYVTHVIGTTVAIGDKAAIAFSGGFYYKLAETGFDYERAFKSGRTAATVAGASKSHFIFYKNNQILEI